MHSRLSGRTVEPSIVSWYKGLRPGALANPVGLGDCVGWDIGSDRGLAGSTSTLKVKLPRHSLEYFGSHGRGGGFALGVLTCASPFQAVCQADARQRDKDVVNTLFRWSCYRRLLSRSRYRERIHEFQASMPWFSLSRCSGFAMDQLGW